MRDSSRIEPISPNNRNEIVSELGLTRRTSGLEKKKIMKPNESPESIKIKFVAIWAICNLCGIGVLSDHSKNRQNKRS